MNKATILLVEDDVNILKANKGLLEIEDYHVLTALCLADARNILKKAKPDLIVLDIMLPDGNGVNFCREIRKSNDVRILFLTALGDPSDIVNGLRSGGDDYIAKPFFGDEFLARVESLLRRNPSVLNEISFGSLRLDMVACRAFIGERDILLKPKEYAILELLARHKEEYIPPETVYTLIWGNDVLPDVRTVHNHIYNLRKKLSGSEITITLKRGTGYRISY